MTRQRTSEFYKAYTSMIEVNRLSCILWEFRGDLTKENTTGCLDSHGRIPKMSHK